MSTCLLHDHRHPRLWEPGGFYAHSTRNPTERDGFASEQV